MNQTTREDAKTEWARKVEESTSESKRQASAITDVERQLDWLTDTIQSLRHESFPHDMDEYRILENARGLYDIVERTMQKIEGRLRECSNEIFDLRRAVEFYKH